MQSLHQRDIDVGVTKTMKTYQATDQYGNTIFVSAYTETEAREKAEQQLGYGNVIRFEPV